MQSTLHGRGYPNDQTVRQPFPAKCKALTRKDPVGPSARFGSSTGYADT